MSVSQLKVEWGDGDGGGEKRGGAGVGRIEGH